MWEIAKVLQVGRVYKSNMAKVVAANGVAHATASAHCYSGGNEKGENSAGRMLQSVIYRLWACSKISSVQTTLPGAMSAAAIKPVPPRY
jgi:hypothetical protein